MKTEIIEVEVSPEVYAIFKQAEAEGFTASEIFAQILKTEIEKRKQLEA
jgi:hypothetical protein